EGQEYDEDAPTRLREAGRLPVPEHIHEDDDQQPDPQHPHEEDEHRPDDLPERLSQHHAPSSFSVDELNHDPTPQRAQPVALRLAEHHAFSGFGWRGVWEAHHPERVEEAGESSEERDEQRYLKRDVPRV